MSSLREPENVGFTFPGIAQQPLHLILLLDCSGSMIADGKIQALNVAVREALPHLEDVSEANPHARVLVRAITFSTSATWHLQEATPAADVRWEDVTAAGFTDLGSALELVIPELSTPPMEPHALPPAIVLVSDGMPTDDYEPSMEKLLRTEWGGQSVRVAIAIGRGADRTQLSEFMGTSDPPLSASNPEQLVEALRWATRRATVLASTLADLSELRASHSPRVAGDDLSEVVW